MTRQYSVSGSNCQLGLNFMLAVVGPVAMLGNALRLAATRNPFDDVKDQKAVSKRLGLHDWILKVTKSACNDAPKLRSQVSQQPRFLLHMQVFGTALGTGREWQLGQRIAAGLPSFAPVALRAAEGERLGADGHVFSSKRWALG